MSVLENKLEEFVNKRHDIPVEEVDIRKHKPDRIE